MQRWGLWLGAAFAGVGIVAVVASNVWVVATTKGRVFDDVGDLPAGDVGLLLGTAKTTRSGNPNPHFVQRVQAVVQLYQAGKIKRLLVSGDNHVVEYDEPTDMKEALVTAGVPASAITLDYAGFRTLDSIVRARKVFGLNRLTVISERFHNYRALFIAQRYGVDAVAYCAKDVEFRFSVKVTLREYLARLKAVADLYVLRTRPRFLGEPVPVG